MLNTTLIPQQHEKASKLEPGLWGNQDNNLGLIASCVGSDRLVSDRSLTRFSSCNACIYRIISALNCTFYTAETEFFC